MPSWVLWTSTTVRYSPRFLESELMRFESDDEANLAQHARRNAQAAVEAAKKAAAQFDAAATNGIASSSKAADGLARQFSPPFSPVSIILTLFVTSRRRGAQLPES